MALTDKKTTGIELKKQLGLEKVKVVRLCRLLVSTYRIYTVFYDSKISTRPITNNEVKRMQFFLPGIEYPFENKSSMLPLLDIEDFNANLKRAMFFVLDIAGRYANDKKLTKTFESEEKLATPKVIFQGPIQEFVTFSDLNSPSVISSVTQRSRTERNRELSPENILAKLVDVNIDTVEDHVTFIFKTTATTPIYPDNYDYSKTNVDNFQLQNNPSKEYELYIRILDFMKWLKGTKPDAEEITLQDVKDVLKVNNVQVFSTSPSFHWQGFNYWMSQLDGSIYPTDIRPTRSDQIHGDGEAFLDKHLYGLIRQISFFANPMASMLTKRLKDRELI